MTAKFVIIDYCVSGNVEDRMKTLENLKHLLENGATIVRADATRDHIVYIIAGAE